MNLNDYSKEELEIIEYFKCKELAMNIEIMPLYRMMVDKAFLTDDKTRYTKALRAAYKMINESKIYRNTQEFNSVLRDILDFKWVNNEN